MKQAQASGNTVLRKKNVFSRMLAQWDLQILLVPGILLVLLFSYVPMYGVVMASRISSSVISRASASG